MSWVKRLVGSRPFQRTAGILAAEYLRLVWKTTRLVIEPDGDARVHWMGAREVNSLPYRRTFLSAYASVLRQAGLEVTYVENAGEPYLLCQGDPPPA